ncbi:MULTISPECIES: 2OG-Fe(II) oxygenase [Xenorhabdus]|uniref:2OG-Fe(II) oxygenase n=4 Tax=Xenorhabdus TaxID=626 RepID=A0A0B6X9U7_XENBV|nr:MULTISPECIES: 2OG-Fe(II) oxygenase [Xenorhabdus]MCG3470438.1 2OG-Fe(II) oxygenase [Xenorhabdus bovienii]MDC9621670.1 2OG-Fe(II) oxygenase [Xenorhabdus aichiensis]MDE1480489.1 2OG-Fe(II) oxygenase [Xenorhabdus bovienii]MDE1492903.1 2OG-Fe(II) oxygenase [Xenorhabdus bovienii]MDE9428517.1 2OG-Fe(II) oxygenase [Xenorhabdus bovienii]
MNIRRYSPDFKQKKEPFEWFCSDRFLSPKVFARLQSEFPQNGYRKSHREEGDEKYYSTWDLLAIDNGVPVLDTWNNLTTAWKSMLITILSEGYRNYSSTLTGRDLTETHLHVRFTIYHENCWLAPHCDRTDKVITQTLYFPTGAIEGGELLILGSSDPDDIKETVAPAPNRSVILLPSPYSWHSVRKVVSGSQHARRALLLHYVSSDNK